MAFFQKRHISLISLIKMRPIEAYDQQSGTSADIPNVPCPVFMLVRRGGYRYDFLAQQHDFNHKKLYPRKFDCMEGKKYHLFTFLDKFDFSDSELGARGFPQNFTT